MNERRGGVSVYLALVVLALVWGYTWVAIKIATRDASPYVVAGARLAIALRVPIVPVAHNAGYLWPKGVLGKRSGTVTVSIGPPIRPEGKDMQRLTNEVETWIEDEVARLGNPLGESPVPHG